MADSDEEKGAEGSVNPFSLDLSVNEFRERDEDFEFYTERLGAITYQKVLTPKSKNFNALTRGNVEKQEGDAPAEVCRQYQPEFAQNALYSYPQVFKDAFQGKLDLEFEDKMHSSSIVGWTAETNRTLLVNLTHLGDLSEDIVPMTETIFPVFTSGKKQLPVTPDVFDRDIMDYEPGVYLVLFDYPGLGSITVQINVYKHKSMWKFNASTYRAELELFFVDLLWDDEYQVYWKDYRRFGKLDRILDKDNVTYGVFGMYAGGPLPPVSHYASETTGMHRICWDQPRSYSPDDYGVRAMEAGFRWDIDYQKGSRRVGYYCSRDALLAVRETKILQGGAQRAKDYKSLLKDYTFVICDGFSSYAHLYGESDTQNIPFKDLDVGSTLGPIIVIVPEGVSCLTIKQSKDNPHYRNSMYYNENPAQTPMVINWKQFQDDFNSEGLSMPGGPGTAAIPEPQFVGIQQIMKLENFPDYLLFTIDSLRREYVFSLKQAPNYYPNQKRYDEYWHVYGCLGQTETGVPNYYYLGTISNSYFQRYGLLQYNKTHFQHSLFPVEISSMYSFVTEPEKQSAREMAKEWRSVMKNVEFKVIVRKLVTINQDQFNNPTINAESRDRRLEKVKINIPD